MVVVGGSAIERDQPAEAMSDHHRAVNPQLRAGPRKLGGEPSNRVPPQRVIAPAMAATVNGDDPMSAGEARGLLLPATPIRPRAIHEHERRVTASGVVVGKHNTVTNRVHHP